MTTKNKPRSRLTLTEKTLIKQQQAGFIEKINTATPNEHQQAIFAAAAAGQGRYVVLAGPGCGKTFTSIKASLRFTGKSIYFSYNNKIMLDTNFKLVAIDSPMVATTAHAFGLQCLQAFTRGKCQVDEQEEKYPLLLRQYLFDQWEAFCAGIQTQAEEEGLELGLLRSDALRWSEQLVHYALVSLAPLTKQGLTELVDAFDLEEINRRSLVWPLVIQAAIAAIEAGKQQFLGARHLVAFDDMVYYPNVIAGVPIRQYEHVVIDEAQDTSRAALELILKACREDTQLFVVGDPRQSIYLFAGAASESMALIQQRLQAQVLPLQICYRCGSKMVELANQLGGELISAGQHEGTIEVLEDYLDEVQPGDAVIARTMACLVRGCLKVLQRGKRARVLGKNIGANIAAVVTAMEALRVRRGVSLLASHLSNFFEVLERYHRQEAKNLEEGRKKPEMALAELEDKVETVKAFFEAYIGKCNDRSRMVADDPTCAFNKTAKDFKLYIHGLFSDEDGAKAFIQYMTAHRAKGGEWEHVYIIGTEEFPHPRAKSEQQKQQERNLMYVAVTRAMERLTFVGQPFAGLSIPGYEPADMQTEDQLEERGAPGDEEGESRSADGEVFEPSLPGHGALNSPDAVIDASVVGAEEIGQREGRIGRIAAIEVLCPACNDVCADPATGKLTISYDLVGHIVICSVCKKECIVPLNAFSRSFAGENVVAREKPTGQTTRREKKGRTQKERKATSGRKTKGKGIRQPMQLSLDIHTIHALNMIGVNKSELFEELLQQYEPFLEALSMVQNEMEENEEFDHDEIEERGE
jgi:DNA helicase II / ATP-dependent DNA helicase PcrA